MKTLRKLDPGDFVEGGVDEIVENLREENPDKEIDYENLYTDSNGYLAEITVDNRAVAYVESQVGQPMVKNIKDSVVREISREEVTA